MPYLSSLNKAAVTTLNPDWLTAPAPPVSVKVNLVRYLQMHAANTDKRGMLVEVIPSSCNWTLAHGRTYSRAASQDYFLLSSLVWCDVLLINKSVNQTCATQITGFSYCFLYLFIFLICLTNSKHKTESFSIHNDKRRDFEKAVTGKLFNFSQILMTNELA